MSRICGTSAIPWRSARGHQKRGGGPRNYGMLPGRRLEPEISARTSDVAFEVCRPSGDHVSTICIVHCLAMPFVIALLPVAALAVGGDTHFHSLMLWFVVPTSVVGLGLGVRVHRRFAIVALGGQSRSPCCRPRRCGDTGVGPVSRGRRQRCGQRRACGGALAQLPRSSARASSLKGVRRPLRERRGLRSSSSSCVKCERCVGRCDGADELRFHRPRLFQRRVQQLAPSARRAPSHGSSSKQHARAIREQPAEQRAPSLAVGQRREQPFREGPELELVEQLLDALRFRRRGPAGRADAGREPRRDARAHRRGIPYAACSSADTQRDGLRSCQTSRGFPSAGHDTVPPSAGRSWPCSTRKSVLLPEPFASVTSQCSPGMSRQVTSRSTCRPASQTSGALELDQRGRSRDIGGGGRGRRRSARPALGRARSESRAHGLGAPALRWKDSA